VDFGEDPWDAVRATARCAWRCADDGMSVDHDSVLEALGAALA